MQRDTEEVMEPLSRSVVRWSSQSCCLIRTPGNMVTPAVAATVAQLLEESGARLVAVMGHTQCAAADAAIDAWLEAHHSPAAWPWAQPGNAQQQRPGLDGLPGGHPSWPLPMAPPVRAQGPSMSGVFCRVSVGQVC